MRRTDLAAAAAFMLLPAAGMAHDGHGTVPQQLAQAAGPAPAAPAATGAWYPSKYGANDQIGAMNLLTPQKVLEAAKLVQRGQVYALGVPVGRDTPAFPPRSASVTVMMPDQFAGNLVPSENKMSYADDMFTGWLGVGSQIDSFAHLGIDNTFYNGNKAADFMRTTGVTKLGVEGIPPMVSRGVLVNMAQARNKPMLEEGEIITADDLRAAMQAQGVRCARAT